MNRKQYILETLERQNITEFSVMDGIHLGLDVLGMAPVVGAAADLTNAALYGAKGQKGMAALSLAAAIPGVGQAATAGKYLSKIPGLSKAAKALTPTAAASAKATKAAKSAKNLSKSADAVYSASKTTLKGAKAAKNVRNSATAIGKAYKATKTAKTAAATKRLASMQATKTAGKAALRGKVIGRAGKAATRAGVLARGNVADTYGFDTGGKKNERADIVSATVSGIKDALAKVPGATRYVMNQLDDYKLGSFQS